MTNTRPFLSSSVRPDGFFDLVILLGLAGSWLGLLGRWHWLLDLCSHFRWQYLVVCVAAVIWTLWRRRRRVLVVSVMSLLLNGWLIASLGIGRAETAGARLKVVSLNVLTSNPNKEGVLKYLQGANADVIFVMEVNAEWVSALEGLRVTHPHGVAQARRDNFGVALFSRVPLKETRFVQDPESEVPSIEARLMHEGRELVIYGTHPLPPVSAEGARLRNGHLERIAGHINGLAVPAMVIGDLNATPWSYGMRLIQAGGTLGYGGSGMSASRPTWSAGSVLAMPIDHALCTPALVIVRREVGPDVGSDHRAVEVEVGWGS